MIIGISSRSRLEIENDDESEVDGERDEERDTVNLISGNMIKKRIGEEFAEWRA